MPESMLETLRKFIFDELIFVDDADGFAADDDLLEAGLDSMAIMRLVLFIEDEFGVLLPDDELTPDNLQTLNRLQAWIKRQQG